MFYGVLIVYLIAVLVGFVKYLLGIPPDETHEDIPEPGTWHGWDGMPQNRIGLPSQHRLQGYSFPKPER